MPRRSRLDYPGAIHHLMARGNRKARIFADDDDRRSFLDVLARTVRAYQVKVFAHCLMDNHYHIVAETPRGNVSAAMRQLNGVFAQRSNRRHRRSGHVFEGRFRSHVVQRQSYLKRATRYVALNPVRAHMTRNARAWPWTSYAGTAGLEPPPEWLSLDWLLTAFDTDSLAEAQRRYVQYVNAPAARKVRINRSAVAIGSKRFVAEAVAAMASPPADRPLPPAFVPTVRPPLSQLFEGQHDWSPERDRVIAHAHETHGYRLSAIARHLDVDSSTISKAIRRARDRTAR